MQNRKNIDDLDYLSELGFEKVKVDAKDITNLKRGVRSRIFFYNSNGFFWFTCILCGAFIGLSVAFSIYNRPVIFPAPKNSSGSEAMNGSAEKENEIQRSLDTIEISSDNFVRKNQNRRPVTSKSSLFQELPEKLEPAVISNLNLKGTPASEEDLKFIPNSPVLFIHDLKVSDYHSLYFHTGKYILLPDIKSVSAALSETPESTDKLPGTPPKIYLHEILSQALLAFKKSDYPHCQFLLSEISKYNPSDINVLFYSGMCFYHRGNYQQAIQKFDECLAHRNNTFFNEAEFYKAMSLAQNGDKDEATALLRKIADNAGFYSQKAMLLLNQ